ncbi:Paf1 complex component [Coemansia aciculifera]|uniref:Paf1 complex component n=1 Tax=Coemansia aciculifera TaxID=417176 RepID=A0ACC1M293_9FUNG|nr:Paf1 complex component [Coemansia aciculifera]
MSDLFGSDLSDIESQDSRLSPTRSRSPSPRRRSPIRDSATPEPRKSVYDSDSGTPTRPSTNAAPNGDALDDLFGSDEDVEMRGSDREATPDGSMAQSDDEAQEEGLSKVNVRVMSARVPLFSVPSSDKNAFILARTPNILQLDPTPFSPDSYEDLIQKEHEVAAKHGVKDAVRPELASAVEGIISNTIRWRRTTGSDGKERRESNARLVRWSDGSTSIVIGGQVPEAYSIMADPLADTATKKQHHYAAVHYQRELLMQSHARLTEQWLLRPTRQSAQSRAAVSLLLGRVRAKALGETAGAGSGAAATKNLRTRFEVDEENPELARKRAIEEDERREKQRKKEERLRERMEAKGLQSERRSAYAGGEYSEEEEEVEDNEYDSDNDARAGGYGLPSRPAKRNNVPRMGVPQRSQRPRSAYADEDLEDFIDDDEPEVGPRDEFDDEEEEEKRAAQRLRSSKHTGYMDDDENDESDRGRDDRRGRGTKSRRLVSDDEDSDN